MHNPKPLVVIGDALLDRDYEGRAERLAPEGPVPVVDEMAQRVRPGGAGLAAMLAALDGREVVLVTALARDDAGSQLTASLESAGVEVIDLGLEGSTPEKIRVRSDGRTLLRLDRGAPASRHGPVTEEALRALASASALLVSDYGRGMSESGGLRPALSRLAARLPIVWDPHPRGAEPVPGVRLATPNAGEAARFAPVPSPSTGAATEGLAAITERGRILAQRWDAAAVAVTLGSKGVLLVAKDGPPVVVPAPFQATGDPCGAGDRFASAVAGFLADGALIAEAVADAVMVASSYVGAGGAAAIGPVERPAARPAPRLRMADAQEVIAQTRLRGGVVVATGGCFDLLHAGHVSVLRQARALGDCLIVCLNSDASVHRLKGTGRPIVGEEDRAAVLAALGCVDAVVVFDEDTPQAILERLKPDVFAKGGDYAVADLPEQRTLERWGGQVVLLPYLKGRSTSSLMQAMADRARG
jgi:rfaE bifunctional protein nucleotidyltransferase chain/domain/rfaE bifunctional protein kinase chain/domain